MNEQPDTITETVVPREFWGLQEVADYLHCAVFTVRKHVREDGLPVRRVGKRLLFLPAEVFAWIEAQQPKSNGGAAADAGTVPTQEIEGK